MASVAPTVTRTSVSGSSSSAVPRTLVRRHGLAQLGDAAARRVLVVALPDGGDGDLAQLLGAVGVGETLAEVDRAGVCGQLGHGGEDRRGEGAQAPGQIRVPRCHRDDRTGGDPRRLSSAPTVLSIANYNMHCGMDGWGRPFDYVAAIRRPRGRRDRDRGVVDDRGPRRGPGRGGGRARSATRSSRTPSAGAGASGPSPTPLRRGWPEPSWSRAATGRCTSTACAPTPTSVHASERWQQAEPGTWGIAVLVRPDLPIEDTRIVPMSVLRADRVERAALVVDLTVEGRPISVVGTHMSHLLYGSHRNWAELRRGLERRPGPTRCWRAT